GRMLLVGFEEKTIDLLAGARRLQFSEYPGEFFRSLTILFRHGVLAVTRRSFTLLFNELAAASPITSSLCLPPRSARQIQSGRYGIPRRLPVQPFIRLPH